MKYPKMKQTGLCNFILILPVLICLLPIPLGIITNKGIFGLLCFIGFILALVYLFKNFVFLMTTDAVFKFIKAKRKDALEFCTDKNGRSRAEIEQRITMRCEAFGKKQTAGKTKLQPVCLVQKISQSAMEDYSVINKNVAVFSLDSLTQDNFNEIIVQTQKCIKSVSNSRDALKFLKDKKQRNAPVCRADTVIILADRVDEYVKEAVRDKSVSHDFDCFLPCVVDCTNGTYYFNACREFFSQGMTPKPPKNYAIAAAHKILFSGKPPYKTSVPAIQKGSEDEEVMKQSLWDFYKEFKNDDYEQDKKLRKQVRNYIRTLDEGEFEINDDFIFLKQNSQLITFSFLSDEENEMNILLTIEKTYYLNKNDRYPKTKLLKKIEKNAALHYVADELKKQGYEVEFIEE